MTALPSIPTKASPLAHSREELGGQGKETPSPTQFSDLLVESPQPKENPSDNLAEEPAPPQKNDEPSDPQPQPNQTDLAMFFSLIAPPPAPIPLADSLPEEFDLTLETPSAPQSETNPQVPLSSTPDLLAPLARNITGTHLIDSKISPVPLQPTAATTTATTTATATATAATAAATAATAAVAAVASPISSNKALPSPTPSPATPHASSPVDLKSLSLEAGTPFAMQDRAMTTTEPLRASSLTTAEPAPTFSTAIVTPQHAPTPHPSPEDYQQSPSEHPQDATPHAESSQSPLLSSFPDATSPLPTSKENLSSITPALDTIVQRTLEATERLRASGNEQLEVKVRLDSGHEVTVSLHLSRGEIKPTFLTDSAELRHALENHWNQFSDQNSERSVRITAPIFASTQTESGQSNLGQKQRDSRDQTPTHPTESNPYRSTPSTRNPRSASPTIPQPSTQTDRIHLYA